MAAAPIKIHDYVLIASDVVITSESHGTQNADIIRYYGDPQLKSEPIEIGEGCWLGERCMILPGVTLGRKCVVAAGAIVTKSFPDYSMLAGIPAKCIKKYNLKTHQWDKV